MLILHSLGMVHCKYPWAGRCASVVVHTHSGVSFRCRKNEVVIGDMNRTEELSKPGIEERWVPCGAQTGGFLRNSSCGSTYHRFMSGKNEKWPSSGHLGIRHPCRALL